MKRVRDHREPRERGTSSHARGHREVRHGGDPPGRDLVHADEFLNRVLLGIAVQRPDGFRDVVRGAPSRADDGVDVVLVRHQQRGRDVFRRRVEFHVGEDERVRARVEELFAQSLQHVLLVLVSQVFRLRHDEAASIRRNRPTEALVDIAGWLTRDASARAP